MKIKLKDLLKESVWGKRAFGDALPTMDDYLKEYEQGKVYTDKDKPPFKTAEELTKINEENESLWTWIYKGMLGGFRKAGKKGGQHLSDVAQASAFLVKTEFGSGAKNDFIKEFKKYL
jgi:hypothetical protein